MNFVHHTSQRNEKTTAPTVFQYFTDCSQRVRDRTVIESLCTRVHAYLCEFWVFWRMFVGYAVPYTQRACTLLCACLAWVFLCDKNDMSCEVQSRHNFSCSPQDYNRQSVRQSVFEQYSKRSHVPFKLSLLSYPGFIFSLTLSLNSRLPNQI